MLRAYFSNLTVENLDVHSSDEPSGKCRNIKSHSLPPFCLAVPGIERMLGLLITTTESVLGFLERLQRDQALLHRHLPLSEIHKAAGKDILFDTLFNYENYRVESAELTSGESDLPIHEIHGHNSNHYPLSLAAIPGEGLGLRLHYSAEAFDQAAPKRPAHRLVRLLEQFSAKPSTPLHLAHRRGSYCPPASRPSRLSHLYLRQHR